MIPFEVDDTPSVYPLRRINRPAGQRFKRQRELLAGFYRDFSSSYIFRLQTFSIISLFFDFLVTNIALALLQRLHLSDKELSNLWQHVTPIFIVSCLYAFPTIGVVKQAHIPILVYIIFTLFYLMFTFFFAIRSTLKYHSGHLFYRSHFCPTKYASSDAIVNITSLLKIILVYPIFRYYIRSRDFLEYEYYMHREINNQYLFIGLNPGDKTKQSQETEARKDPCTDVDDKIIVDSLDSHVYENTKVGSTHPASIISDDIPINYGARFNNAHEIEESCGEVQISRDLRSSDLETSIRVINVAQRTTPAVAQQKTYAPPFVNNKNEFDIQHIGRFYYFFQKLSVERLTRCFIVICFVFNMFVGCTFLLEDFCISDSLFGRHFFYILGLIPPILAHCFGLRGVRTRRSCQLVVFIIYSFVEVCVAMSIDFYVALHIFVGTHCSTHIVLAGSLLSVLAYFHLVAIYYAYENICFIKRHLRPTKGSRQRAAITRLNTVRSPGHPRNMESSLIGVSPTNSHVLEPSEDIQDTLQQVILTWEYQRDRRRNFKPSTNAKFGQNLLRTESGR